jgi:RNA polymerase sigma-70 factor (ECF subfamily)
MLFETTYPAVLRYARHRNLRQHDAEDLAAAVYEVAWRRLDAVPEGDEALPWLLRVAFNQLRNDRRKRAREHELLQLLPAPEHALPPSELGSITWQDIRQALDTLAHRDRELVLLCAWDGLSLTHAARILGCNPVTARTRLHRARKRLTQKLKTTTRDQHEQWRPTRAETDPSPR